MMSDRRPSIVERRPSSALSSRRPSIIPQLEGIEKPNTPNLPENMNVDVLICGTGLINSILAAALSWQGTSVLHIDSNPYYGDDSATLTIEQIKNWFIGSKFNKTGFKNYKNIHLYINDNDFNIVSKDYGIDLSPKILFPRSSLLDLLIKSRVYHYLEFQSLSNFHTFENNNLGKLNANKEDIFTSNEIDLNSKRKLMKFLKFISSPVIELPDNLPKDISIQNFLKKNFKLDDKLINEIIFTLGLINNPKIQLIDALNKIKRYILSFNIYGNFPTLYSKFGGPGEISQGFCRSAAVAGTIYKLNTKLKSYDFENKTAILNDGSNIKINERIISSLNQSINKPENCKFYEISRIIAIVDKSCNEWFQDGESSSIIIFPPNSLNSQNEYPVQCLIMGSETGCCPKGRSIWYLHTIAPTTNDIAINDLNSALLKLEENYIRESTFNFNEFNDDDLNYYNNNKPILTESGSMKLSKSLLDFKFKFSNERINYLMKLSFTQLTNIDQLNPENINGYNKEILKTDNNIIIVNMPSSELSYDGIVEEAKKIYKEIVGDDSDFFNVDFEDEEEEIEISNELDAEIKAEVEEIINVDNNQTTQSNQQSEEFEMELES